MIKGRLHLLFLAVLLFSCHNRTAVPAQKKIDTIIVQAFSGTPEDEVDYVFAALQKMYPLVERRKNIDLPKAAWNPGRKRYRADSLINYLKSVSPPGSITLGLTHKDISTTKGSAADWGVMGLGFCPGKACIASGFRLSVSQRKIQLYKVALHELGHTQGLPHCPVEGCIMRDAEGKNATNDEKSFCPQCTTYLSARGWKQVLS